MDKTLIKGLSLLEMLTRAGEPMSVTQLAERMGLFKSNAHRILQTLVHCGYVMQAADGRYTLSLRLWELGTAVLADMDISTAAKVHLRALAEDTGETVYLSVLDGTDIIYIDKIDSTNSVRAFMRLGGRAPAYCSATGKAMLAHSPAELVRAVARVIEHRTALTVADLDHLKQDLAATRRRGFAINIGEWEEAIRGVAAPILDMQCNPLGAVGITAPEQRMPDGSYRIFGRRVQEAATAIMSTMNGGGRTATKAAVVSRIHL
jgi:DNA-binding IclR family transcriptional regulator